jgi:heme A synthase
MKGFSSRLYGFFFESAHLFIMILSFFAPFLSMQNISQPMVGVMLPVNSKKTMIPIFGSRLLSFLLGGLRLTLSNLRETTKMKREQIKPFLWGIAVGAIVLLIVVFSAGWVVTSGSAQLKAKTMATDAVMDRLAPMSIAQFMQDPNREVRLKELKELDYWKRGEYVQKQGWATMPGEKEADSTVAAECARRLLELTM